MSGLTIAACIVFTAAAAFALGVLVGAREAYRAAARARAAHNAEENRRRTEQAEQLASLNRQERRRLAKLAARNVARKDGAR